MKLGILTDIHEHVEFLTRALERFRSEEVDQVVVIGDLFETGKQMNDVCRMLSDADAVGVWGNHDYGLCVDPNAETCDKYGERVINFMTSLQPRLNIDGCHFTHVEPWLNTEQVLDLWYFEQPPTDQAGRNRIFDSVPNRLLFTGHNHRWLLLTPNGTSKWRGEQPVDLSDGRFFMVVGALCDGHCAILDTETSRLVPFSLR